MSRDGEHHSHGRARAADDHSEQRGSDPSWPVGFWSEAAKLAADSDAKEATKTYMERLVASAASFRDSDRLPAAKKTSRPSGAFSRARRALWLNRAALGCWLCRGKPKDADDRMHRDLQPASANANFVVVRGVRPRLPRRLLRPRNEQRPRDRRRPQRERRRRDRPCRRELIESTSSSESATPRSR